MPGFVVHRVLCVFFFHHFARCHWRFFFFHVSLWVNITQKDLRSDLAGWILFSEYFILANMKRVCMVCNLYSLFGTMCRKNEIYKNQYSMPNLRFLTNIRSKLIILFWLLIDARNLHTPKLQHFRYEIPNLTSRWKPVLNVVHNFCVFISLAIRCQGHSSIGDFIVIGLGALTERWRIWKVDLVVQIKLRFNEYLLVGICLWDKFIFIVPVNVILLYFYVSWIKWLQ